jgi:hypothetical protein
MDMDGYGWIWMDTDGWMDGHIHRLIDRLTGV